MITKFDFSPDFTTEYLAYLAADNEIVSAGESLKIYIPVLMNNITNGDAVISNLSTNGKAVFKNAAKCRPALTSSVLKEKNYMTATLANNSSIESIKVSKVDKNGVLYEEYLPKGSGVRCSFLNGKISKLTFNTNITSVPDDVANIKNENSRYDLQDVTLQLNIV